MISAVVWNAWHEREVKLAEAETIATNISNATAQHARDTIESADNLLAGIVEIVEASPVALNRERLQRHVEGDACLRMVGGALAKVRARPTDGVARYGGEEFCLILPGADAAGGKAVAKRVMQAIKALQIPHEHNECGTVTVSVGVACMVPERGKAAEELLKAADSALYLTKEKGRNQIYSFAL